MQKTEFNYFKKALEMTPEEVIGIVEESGLRGRGGASFPTGMKWRFVSKEERENKYLICNFDEGEPGTFKDKFIVKNNPDLLVEGIAIAAYAVGADKAYIYLREEYHDLKKVLEDTISKNSELLGKLEIVIFEGAGAYICGDETAIMNSIEGSRGEPRAKPPYPAQQGLWGLPTCINNVETLANVPLIIKGGWKNLLLFSLSGDVGKPGVYELPFGVKARDLMDLGEPRGEVKALCFGASGGYIKYDPEVTLDEKTVRDKGAMLGSGTVIVVGTEKSIPQFCHNIAKFFVHESCGKCSPCRIGGVRILEILDKVLEKKHSDSDITMLEELADCICKTSFCGLGQTLGNHVKTALKNFRQEFEVI